MIKGDDTAVCAAARMVDIGCMDLLLEHGARADLGHPLAYFGESFHKDSQDSFMFRVCRSFPSSR